MANINIRVEDSLKSKTELIFDELGLNMSTAVTAFLKQVVRCGGIPFELRIDPRTSYIERALDEADEEARHPGPRISHEEFIKEMRGYVKELSAQTDTAVPERL